MASQDVINAVESGQLAQWTHMPIIGWVRRDERTDESASFLQVQYPVANEEQITIGAPGANVWREEGVIRLVLLMNRDEDRATILQRADELRSLFRGKEFAGVQTFAPTPPAIDDNNDDGNFLRLSIAVPYQFDRLG